MAAQLQGTTENDAPTLRELRLAVSDAGVRLRPGEPLTQAQLGARAGIVPTYISSIELGKYKGSRVVWLRLSKALGVSTEAVVLAILASEERARGRQPHRPRGTHARRARGPVAERERRTR